jgi:hypothetical protein
MKYMKKTKGFEGDPDFLVFSCLHVFLLKFT